MRRTSSTVWALLAVAWALLVWWLLTFELLPSVPLASRWLLPELLQRWVDKAAHAALFLVQAFLCARAAHEHFGLRRALLLAVGFCLAYGAATELRQRTLPNREADLADFAADGVGALAGAAALALSRRWSRARARVPA